ncbi:MAG TPA: hypothetical protein VHM90_20605, partial [Phycisphaerae bacterium]|nr:hypothetical protein [Phycisphaerae bacterium]
MRRRSRSAGLMLEALESRTLLSGTMQPYPLAPIASASPAVQADLQRINTDQQKLQADLKSLQPTLKADQQALTTAISALSGLLDPLRAKYQADSHTWRAAVQTDLAALSDAQSAGDAAAVAAQQAKLQADRLSQQTALH